MPAVITTYANTDGSYEPRLSISETGVSRQMSIGTDWQKIRIALRLSVMDSGGDCNDDPKFSIGISNGTGSIFSDQSPSNCIGVWPLPSVDMTRTVGAQGVYYVYYPVSARKVGISEATGSNSQLLNSLIFTGSYHSALYVDITKGTPNYTIGFFGRNNTNRNDVDRDTFYMQAETPSPVIPNHAMSAEQTILFDESSGSLNTINISWDRIEPKILVSDLAVVRLI